MPLTKKELDDLLVQFGSGFAHPVFNWQMAAVLVTILVAGAVMIIQLGAAQTQISNNTGVIGGHTAELKSHSTTIARLEASDVELVRRLAAVDVHDVETRKVENEIARSLAKFEASQVEQDRRLAAVELSIKDAAAKADLIQATNTLRVEFLAEIKRIDQQNAQDHKR